MVVARLGLYVTALYFQKIYQYKTIIELSHRAVSAISLIVVLWLVITTWKNIGYIKEIKPLSIVSVGFY